MRCLLTRNCNNTDDYIKLTKNEISQILIDYNIQNKTSNKQILIKKMKELNATICIQQYIIEQKSNCIKINEVCPITQEIPKIYLYIYTKDKRKPFNFFKCIYDLRNFAKYLIMTSRFEDIITKTPLNIRQIKEIDLKICENLLFLPSLYNLYQTNEKANIEYERNKLLVGLERSIANDIARLYNYIDYSEELTQNEIRILLKDIIIVLFQIKKIDINYFNFVKSDIIEHLQKIKCKQQPNERKVVIVNQLQLL